MAVGHNPTPVMLDSETTGPSTRRSAPSAMRNVRHGKHRRVQAEHELMIEHAQCCQQEASLLSDKACWCSIGWVATCANLVVQLLRSVRANWLKPGDGVMEAAERIAAQPGGSVPPHSAKSMRKFWREWRSRGCIGFPKDVRGRNHRFTILRDARPVFEDDVRACTEGKLTSKDGKLSVASFAKALNDDTMPRHDGRPSELRDMPTFPSQVPHVSHAVAWRCMVQLGFKHGALNKGGTLPFLSPHNCLFFRSEICLSGEFLFTMLPFFFGLFRLNARPRTAGRGRCPLQVLTGLGSLIAPHVLTQAGGHSRSFPPSHAGEGAWDRRCKTGYPRRLTS